LLFLYVFITQELSRAPAEKPSTRNDYDAYSEEHESGIFITGRIVLNLWRRMRSELKLQHYSYNYVAAELLNRRVPCFTQGQLLQWWRSRRTRDRTIRHLLRLAELNLALLDKLDLVRRTAECARLYGIDFFSVITRGSQYRVEAALVYQAHLRGFIAVSPSKKRVANQAAMAVIPLVSDLATLPYGGIVDIVRAAVYTIMKLKCTDRSDELLYLRSDLKIPLIPSL
jgi:DNA polymerase zeta